MKTICILIYSIAFIALSIDPAYVGYNGGTGNNTTITNGGAITVTGSLLSQSNIYFQTRGNLTNVIAGGTFFLDTTSYTNVSATPTVFTNLGTILVPGNMLTNNGDRINLYWEVDQKVTSPNTNNFKIISGALTPADFGLLITSNGTVIITARVVRLGNSLMRFTTKGDFSGTQGKVFTETNIHPSSLVLDCGTNNPFTLQAAAQAFVALTNVITIGEYYPKAF